MNQIISTKLGLALILTVSFGLGFFLWRLDQKVTAEINQAGEISNLMLRNSVAEIQKKNK